MQEVIAKFLMRGTGMDYEIALVRSGHLIDDLARDGFVIVPKVPNDAMLARLAQIGDGPELSGGEVWGYMLAASIGDNTEA